MPVFTWDLCHACKERFTACCQWGNLVYSKKFLNDPPISYIVIVPISAIHIYTVYGKTSAGNLLWLFTQPQIFSRKLLPCQSAIQVYRNTTATVLP